MADKKSIQNKIMMDRARAATLSRDYTLAIRLYSGLLKNDPKNVELLSSLGSIYEKNRQDADAIPLYKEIVRLEPDNIEALNSLGGIYRRLKRYEESIAVLEQALLTDADNSQVYYNLGFTYKLMGNKDDAIDCFNRVVSANPNDVLAFNHLGSIYDSEKQFDKAENAYMKGLKADPNHPILHLNLAQLYEKMNRDEEAMREYEAALRSRPGWIDAISGFADLLLKKNKTKNAGELVQQAIRLTPSNAKMHTKLAAVYARQTNYELAEDEYNEALKIDPENETALSGLADTYEASGKPSEAIRTMKKIEEMKPNDSLMLKQYSNILLTANKLNAASQKIKQVWDMNPDDVQTLNLLGQYYICRGNEEKVKGCFNKIKNIDPQYSAYLRDGAKRYRQKGEYERAEKFCLRYLEDNPHDPIGIALLAADYEDLNDFASALKYYQSLSEIDGDNVCAKHGQYRAKSVLSGRPLSEVKEEKNIQNDDSFGNALAETSDSEIAISDEDLLPEEGFEITDGAEPLLKEDSNLGEDLDFPAGGKDDSAGPEEDFSELSEEDKDGFDFQSLAVDEADGAGVFTPNDYDLDAGDEEEFDENSLDNLVPEKDPLAALEQEEDDKNFFKNNPFGKNQGKTKAPQKDDYESMFEDEDIDDDRMEGQSIALNDGMDSEESLDEKGFEDDFEAAPDEKNEDYKAGKNYDDDEDEGSLSEPYTPIDDNFDFADDGEEENELKNSGREKNENNRGDYKKSLPHRPERKNSDYSKGEDEPFVLDEMNGKDLPLNNIPDEYEENKESLPERKDFSSSSDNEKNSPLKENSNDEFPVEDEEVKEIPSGLEDLALDDENLEDIFTKKHDEEDEKNEDVKDPENQLSSDSSLPLPPADEKKDESPYEEEVSSEDFADNEENLDLSDEMDSVLPSPDFEKTESESGLEEVEPEPEQDLESESVLESEPEVEPETEPDSDLKEIEPEVVPESDTESESEGEENPAAESENAEEENIPTVENLLEGYEGDSEIEKTDFEKACEDSESTDNLPELVRDADIDWSDYDKESSDDENEDENSEEEIPVSDDEFNLEEENESPDSDDVENTVLEENPSEQTELSPSDDEDFDIQDPFALDSEENTEKESFKDEEPSICDVEEKESPDTDDGKDAVLEEDIVSPEEILSSVEEKEEAVRMLEKLQSLSQYLPEEKRLDFVESRTQFKIAHLIAKLSGRKGLLFAAERLRSQMHWDADYQPYPENSVKGKKLVRQVFDLAGKLVKDVPDQEAADGLVQDMKDLEEKLKDC